MRRSSFRSMLQYALAFVLAFGLMWLSFRGLTTIEGENRGLFLWQVWKQSDKWYLWIMAFMLTASHMLRAYRWNLLLVPTGYSAGFSSSFLTVMVGYLFNLALPRGGEVSRCYNLLKLEEIPVAISFGTVIAERSIDLLCLLLVMGLAMLLEWNKLSALIVPWVSISDKNITILLIVVGIVLLVGLIAYFLRKNEKLAHAFSDFKKGFFSILRLKNISSFVSLSVLMWLLYFVMTYFVMLAFPTTHDLGLRAAVAIFAISSVALSIPLPGGVGSYHTLVPSVLIALYSVARSDAIAAVFILHAWQTVVTLVLGVVSLLVSYQLIRWKKYKKK